MSVTNLSRYGSTEAPAWAVRQRKINAAADRRAHLQGLRRRREEMDAGKQIVRFDQSTFDTLKRASVKKLGGSSSFFALTSANGFIENRQVCIRISPETAREWASWMRQPGVGLFADVLARLDEIAGKARPDGRAIKIQSDTFQAILATLEGSESGAIPDAGIAAKFLRKGRVENGLIYVYVSEAQAARLAEVFVAAKVDRLLIVSLDIIAGRTEPRPH